MTRTVVCRRLWRVLAALILAMLPAAASACISCSCTTSASSLSFGTYDSVSALPRDASALVSIDCNGLVALLGVVEVRVGTGSSNNQLQRTMVQAATGLNYNLYADIARSQILGDGTGGTTTATASLNGLLTSSTVIPVFGRIPAGQWVGSGTYTDTVIITVQY
ncbi:spore coat protein U domain-containing protein [Sphingomonas kaistensis]|uniref:Spore coat protein U domain-containing protein n=1 Tax=Sphingomonas kaistensis TaxID=298708 RepID=A0ABZ2G0U3_9SPHN